MRSIAGRFDTLFVLELIKNVEKINYKIKRL